VKKMVKERIEKEKMEVKRLEAERKEKERLEKERVEKERIEAERMKREKMEAEKKAERDRMEREKMEAERREKERVEKERVEAEKKEKEQIEVKRLETERKEKERLLLKSVRPRKKHSRLSGQVVVFSVALILIGLASVGIFTLFLKSPDVPAPPQIPSFIFTDAQREISATDLAGDVRSQLHEEKNQVAVSSGSIEMLFFTRGTPPNASLLPADEFIALLNTRVPSQLIRSLASEFTFGFHAIGTTEPFLILKTRSFNIAFAGMLEWEKSMNEDLAPLFGPVVSVPPATFQSPQAFSFTDKVIRNKDVRVLRAAGFASSRSTSIGSPFNSSTP